MKGWTPYNRAVAVALLFHVSGALGMILGYYSNWFVRMTPINLLVMFGLLLYTHTDYSKKFRLFLFLAFSTGMITEMIGVNTGKLFGLYQYSRVLGPGIGGVPLLIGINWFLVVWCSAQCVLLLHQEVLKWLGPMGEKVSEAWLRISLVVDGALLATLFDWVLEPAAVKLGYWTWLQGSIPIFNYVCWFLISALLIGIFQGFGFRRINQFAVHLFIIQMLFFLAIRTFY
ncbi:MAG: carotenoid biosynthesis protein [Chitinophagia bacterium]|jgi:putative membrane protein